MNKPWFAIGWFTVWGAFQTFAVLSVLAGTWKRPDAFPAAAYESLIYPDMVFIPLYFIAATLLFTRHWLGTVAAFVAGGGIVYAMVYLLALSELSGTINLTVDGIALGCTVVALWQVDNRARAVRAV